MKETKTNTLTKRKLSQTEKQQLREEKRREKKKLKRKKKNALVVCRNGKQFWTTQDQFWQWVREKSLVKTGNNPLKGTLVRKDEEYSVVISNTVLNLACPNHLREALHSRKYRVA